MARLNDDRLPKFFWDRVSVKDDGCWEWTGWLNWGGYGMLQQKIDGKWKGRRAHRIAYEALIGEITEPALDHLCRNRACVNPDHLEPVSIAENNRRGIGGLNFALAAMNTTHCPNGHEYSPDNTYRDAKGSRNCRTCRNAAARRYKQRQKEVSLG